MSLQHVGMKRLIAAGGTFKAKILIGTMKASMTPS
jgi:hypothetical protein